MKPTCSVKMNLPSRLFTSYGGSFINAAILLVLTTSCRLRSFCITLNEDGCGLRLQQQGFRAIVSYLLGMLLPRTDSAGGRGLDWRKPMSTRSPHQMLSNSHCQVNSNFISESLDCRPTALWHWARHEWWNKAPFTRRRNGWQIVLRPLHACTRFDRKSSKFNIFRRC